MVKVITIHPSSRFQSADSNNFPYSRGEEPLWFRWKRFGRISEEYQSHSRQYSGQSLGYRRGRFLFFRGRAPVWLDFQAYMLYGGGKTGQQADPYKTDVIDTIVAEVQSRPGEDRCVLLLGYKDQMMEMFQVSIIFLRVKFRVFNADSRMSTRVSVDALQSRTLSTLRISIRMSYDAFWISNSRSKTWMLLQRQRR